MNNIELLILVKDCIEGTATDWMSLHEASWFSYDDCKAEFLAYFWSPEKQAVEKRKVLAARYDFNKYLSMCDFFLRQVKLLRSFTPRMSDIEILNEVMRQFPGEIQTLWMVINEQTLENAVKFLQKHAAVSGNSSQMIRRYANAPYKMSDNVLVNKSIHKAANDPHVTGKTFVLGNKSTNAPNRTSGKAWKGK